VRGGRLGLSWAGVDIGGRPVGIASSSMQDCRTELVISQKKGEDENETKRGKSGGS